MSKGRSSKQATALKRYFRGMPVVDAAHSLRVFVNDRDIKKAAPKDPSHCVYANACRRLYGSSAVLFFRSVAYVDLPDERGNRVVNRFTIDNEVRERIVQFDKTGAAHPGGFLLSAPRPSKTLDRDRKAQKAYKARRAAGKAPDPVKRAAALKGRAIIAALGTDVRDGSGMVHFVK